MYMTIHFWLRMNAPASRGNPLFFMIKFDSDHARRAFCDKWLENANAPPSEDFAEVFRVRKRFPSW
jgi:hypothetical protein